MNTNLKTVLINAIQFELSDHLDPDTLKLVTNVVTIKLNDYEVSEKCTDLVTVETESEVIVKMFLATKKLEGRSPKTLNNYARRLSDMMNVVNKPIKEYGVYDLRMYLASKQINGVSDRSVDGYRSIITSFFNWAYGEQMIPNNPCLNLGVIKYKREIKKPYSKVELEHLRNCCTSTRDRTIMETLLATGCRISELINIRISDIDFVNSEIKVLGKGNKERIVYVDAVTLMWINKYLEERKGDSEMLFSAKGREGITAGGVRWMLSQLSKISGVENVHPHRFRRTLATTLIERGMSIQEVATILGHSNINTTMTYVYLDDKKVKASYNKCAA